jgi:RNA polymerase sigma-70 factor (ECF subfamily)
VHGPVSFRRGREQAGATAEDALLKNAGEQHPPLERTELTTLNPHEFGALLEPHRRELRVHCYRMLGSVHEAEDLVQETFLRAWRRRETFEGRATLRAWLYKIATNACLDALAKGPRRMLPVTRAASSSADAPVPPALGEPIWLEPFLDELLAPDSDEPEKYLAARENISVAFMAALHLLPSRQRAVLLMRDVLEWQASEVAALLDLSVPAVKSALHRARATLAANGAKTGADAIAERTLDQATRERLDEYILAWENADVARLVAVLKADATFSMPPIPSWYQGRDNIRKLAAATIFSGAARGRWRLLPTRANGQTAFGLYQRSDEGERYGAYGIQVVREGKGGLEDITTFKDASLFAYFKLPIVMTAD